VPESTDRKIGKYLYFYCMKESVYSRLRAITKKAHEQGKKQNIKTVSSSSLHQVIKTKEQADLFMKLLKDA